MSFKVYLPLSVVVFVATTTVADLVALTTVAHEPLAAALREHLDDMQFLGSMFLFAPFVTVALMCSRAETQARARSVFSIFVVSMGTLFYFYFHGYQNAQHAVLLKKWTAAALSVGLLPFFIGGPVVCAVWGALVLARKFDQRTAS